MSLEFGLIGNPLGHSYSKEIHESLGLYSYDLRQIAPSDLDAFLKTESFRGLNVTIPYKQTVIPYCTELSGRAERIGSVNTIVRRADGSLYGDNTDYAGFLAAASKAGICFSGKKVLVFGSGGTSKTARCAVEDCGGKVTVISRSGPDNYTNLDRHGDAQILINTTPLGMYPDTDASPADLRRFPACEGVIDVVYNPLRTRFLQQAEELKIPFTGGLRMLVTQAVRAAELFTASEISDEKIDEIYNGIERKKRNVLLIGMPGSGKTGLGKKVAHLTGRTFYDTDALIEERTGRKIPEIFSELGEEAFRTLEEEVLSEACRKNGAVIATGGGAVMRESNRRNIRENSFVVYVDRDLSLLTTKGRPLSAGKGAVSKLYSQRRGFYLKCADAIVKNNGSFSAAVARIMEAANETACD